MRDRAAQKSETINATAAVHAGRRGEGSRHQREVHRAETRARIGRVFRA